MVAGLGNVHDGIEIRRLPGRSQHRRHSAFKVADLGSHSIIGRILKPRIEISGFLQVKQTSHLLAARIPECCALIDREHSRFSVARFIS